MDTNAIIEGAVKFRDGKKWKTRWCVMTKISPVADCLHLQLYRDCKDRYKQGQTKASLSLQHFLGLESGFTLDKESNTVAIICQDLTVVLAFDTRERLIQWQVKIGTHLGDDQQFLIQISSAPPKSKVSPGPARLHIQDYKFCLTAGVPPRLLGVWEIENLRRYGVVDGKFCFEGGSRCGRGEGLHILGCGQASEVQQALQLASQGRMATKRRPFARKMSAMDSPRKTLHLRNDPRSSDLGCTESLLGDLHHGSATMEDLTGGRSRSPWSSSADSSDMLDSCSDVTSVIAAGDLMQESSMRGNSSMERCASCISKLGSSVKSTSGFNPAWTMDHHSRCVGQHDRASLSSGSSGGSSSATAAADCWYDRPRAVQMPVIPPKSPRRSPPGRCQCCPPERPPKPPCAASTPKKCPRALPGYAQQLPQDEHNYDVPRSILHSRVTQERHSSMDYYDTPRNMREYANYDTPPSAKSIHHKQQGCRCGAALQQQFKTWRDGDQRRNETEDLTGLHYKYSRTMQITTRVETCPCQRVTCWPLPCRRGSGAEDTGVPIHKVRLNGEGRMPVRDPSGQLSVLYASVDRSKKKSRPSPNYVNLQSETMQQQSQSNSQQQQANYANMDFAQSLENYENARDILQRVKDDSHLCHKCGHHPPPDQYLVMKPFPGYLAMGPPSSHLGRASSIPALASNRVPPIPGETVTQEMIQIQRKRSSSADASRFLSDGEDEIINVEERPESSTDAESSLHLTDQSEVSVVEAVERLATLPRSNLEELRDKPVAVHIRRSSSVPCKTGHNRDSSSSNDSGVSAGSPHFPELPACIHSSLPRRCRSSDPLKDVRAHQQAIVPAKSSSAEAEVPVIQPTPARAASHTSAPTGNPALPDSHSTSSGTSDMSDYIETLSLSSHSSSDIPDSLRLQGRTATTTLRPRSGREYQNRAFIETDLKNGNPALSLNGPGQPPQQGNAERRGLASHYNPGVEKCESPSPGYMSGSPGQEQMPR